MRFVFLVFIGFGLLWWLIFSTQRSRTVGIKLRVPRWLAKLSGSKTEYVDAGLLSLQVFCLMAMIWALPSGLLHGIYIPGDVFGIGFLVITFLIMLLFLILVYIAKRRES